MPLRSRASAKRIEAAILVAGVDIDERRRRNGPGEAFQLTLIGRGQTGEVEQRDISQLIGLFHSG